MAAKDLHRPPKGTRTPGSGRKKGTPNRVSVEARTLVSELVNNPIYQHKLRTDFARRRVHPTIESLVWQYHIGKPTQPIAIAGALALDVNARLAEERAIFAQLDLHDLEQLAAESQALVDRALSLAKVAGNRALSPPEPAVEGESEQNPSANRAESDNEYSVNLQTIENIDENEGK